LILKKKTAVDVQTSWHRTESWHFQTSAEDTLLGEILLTTKCIQRIRDFLQYALYQFTLYLLTYLQTQGQRPALLDQSSW